MQRVPVGIDLGTTYSCVSHLDRQGEPHTLPNTEGELSTPSVVLFDGDDVVVGTEALRNSVAHPDRVIQNAKRWMGDANKAWVVDGQTYRPPDVAALVLKYLLKSAEQHVGPIEHAVITVPAQFSDIQRQQTAEAGIAAGLKKVDIINEPVAAALCYVLGEGLWFAELADEQTVMVYDLGGGTFDLSLVKYNQTEVKVRASSGDLNLGGIDWNRRLETFACDEFVKQIPQDPRLDRESMQGLAIEVEQTKRSLSVRQRASLTVQHAGRRKVFGIDQRRFELLTHDLVERTEQITLKLLKDHRLGWAHVNAVLVTGGASRMPMIRNMLQRISGTTLNQTLSPDQSISHGAAYYAGMLASGTEFSRKSFLSKEATARLAKFTQQSVNARALGILVRDKQTGERVPHYLIPANTPLPCAFRQSFGTVADDQRRVHLHIVESGTFDDRPPVKLGACVVEDLPAGLPAATPVEVTIRYDEQARVHVSAKEMKSGKSARTSIVREENLVALPGEQAKGAEAALLAGSSEVAGTPGRQPPPLPGGMASRQVAVSPSKRAEVTGGKGTGPQPGAATARPTGKGRSTFVVSVENADRPIPLCDKCGEPLTPRGKCAACGAQKVVAQQPAGKKPAAKGGAVSRGEVAGAKPGQTAARGKRPASTAKPTGRTAKPRPVAPPLDESEVADLDIFTAKTERMPRDPGHPPTRGKS
ncbi:MAG: Hsp70 family protein [Planctomycetaceae bacterium]